MCRQRHHRPPWPSIKIVHRFLSYRQTLQMHYTDKGAQCTTRTRPRLSMTTSTLTTTMSFSRSRSIKKCWTSTIGPPRSKTSRSSRAVSSTTEWSSSYESRAGSRTRMRTLAASKSPTSRRWIVRSPCPPNSSGMSEKHPTTTKIRRNSTASSNKRRPSIKQTRSMSTTTSFKTSRMSHRETSSSLLYPMRTARARPRIWAISSER